MCYRKNLNLFQFFSPKYKSQELEGTFKFNPPKTEIQRGLTPCPTSHNQQGQARPRTHIHFSGFSAHFTSKFHNLNFLSPQKAEWIGKQMTYLWSTPQLTRYVIIK